MSPLEIPAIDPRPGINYPLYETWLHRLVVWLASRLAKLFMVINVTGVSNLPESGAAIVAANHLVTFDVVPLQLALPRMVYYMGKAELFQNGLIHYLFRQMGAFPVYRGERDAWALEHARKILSASQLVAMFPEGTRSRGKGLALARPGAARLAIEMNCPLVIVSVDGIQNLFKHFPQRAQVNIVIAPALVPQKDDSPLALTDSMMTIMAANLPLELRGVYAEQPPGF